MSEINFFREIDYLVLEANSGCNLACKFCNRKDQEALGLRAAKNMTHQELKFILDKLSVCKINMIKFEGLSEPMLHPQFHELSQILRQTFNNAFIIIATNLQYNLRKVPFLQTIPFVDMIYLSIDGVGQAYEEARPGAKFEKLIKSLDDINELVDENTRAQKLHINFTLSPENYETLPSVYELQKKYKLASVRINLAQNWNEKEKNKLSFNKKILTFLEPYKNDVKGVGGWDYNQCFWPFNGLIVDVFGDIRQCIINMSMDAVGNIFKDDIETLYNESLHFKTARSMLNKNTSPKQCQNCDYKYLAPTLYDFFGGVGPNPSRKKAGQ